MLVDEPDGIENVMGSQHSPADNGVDQSNTWEQYIVDSSYYKFVTPNGRPVSFEPGIYFVGDITPLLPLDDIAWIQEQVSTGHEGQMELGDGRKIAVWATFGSTYRHLDESNREYFLSRPLIGIIEIELEINTNMDQGQVDYYKSPFECSCREGEVPEGTGVDDTYQKIRILKFGEIVKFTLYEYNTCEGMRQQSEPRIENIMKWRNKKQKTTGPIDKFGLGVARFFNEIGLDPNELDEESKKNLVDMFKRALPFYVHTGKDEKDDHNEEAEYNE